MQPLFKNHQESTRLGQAFAYASKRNADPYLKHPMRVAELLASTYCTEDMQVAAILHETLHAHKEIAELFGRPVADLVAWFEYVPTPWQNTTVAMYCARLDAAPNEAKTIMLADLIATLETISDQPIGCEADYLRQAMHLIDTLHGGSSELWHVAWLSMQRVISVSDPMNGVQVTHALAKEAGDECHLN